MAQRPLAASQYSEVSDVFCRLRLFATPLNGSGGGDIADPGSSLSPPSKAEPETNVLALEGLALSLEDAEVRSAAPTPATPGAARELIIDVATLFVPRALPLSLSLCGHVAPPRGQMGS